MRSVVVLIFFFTVSFADLDFYSKVRNFSLDLLYHVVQDADQLQDVMISPYAIWSMLLSLAYETSGVTREQFAKVLSLADDRNEVIMEFQKMKTSVLVDDLDRGLSIEVQNFLSYDEEINVYSDAIRRLKNDFGFNSRHLKFPNREDFVNTAMIMYTSFVYTLMWSNSLNWEKKIVSLGTNGNTYKYILHTTAPLRSSSFDSLHANVTELPYEGDYCMLLIKPHSGYNVKQVLRNLKEVSLEHVLAKLQSDSDEFGLKELEVTLPFDRIKTHANLQKPLSNMGLADVFDEDSANFSNFAGDDIYIGEISQEAMISFLTSDTVGRAIAPSNYGETRAEERSPGRIYETFIFFIMHKSTATVFVAGYYNEILFVGEGAQSSDDFF